MSLVDFTKLQTTPGDIGPFAPQTQWSGSPDTYKKRLSIAVSDQRDRQQFLLAIMSFENKGGIVGFEGRFAEAAREVYETLKAEKQAQKENGVKGGVQ